MKKKRLLCLSAIRGACATLIACVPLMGLSVAARAQTEGVVAKIPFAFHIGNQTLPAGTYKVARSNNSSPSCLLISNTAAHDSVFVVEQSEESTIGSAKLVFDRYGESYFLREVDTGSVRHSLSASPEEKTLAVRLDRTATLAVAGD
jgi:hypothetical protein